MDVTKAWDGEECLEKVFAHDPLYYSIIVVSNTFFNSSTSSSCKFFYIFYRLLTSNL